MDLPAGLASTRLSRIVAPVVVGRGTQATAAAAAPPPARPIEPDAPPPALAPPHLLSEQQLKSFVETGFLVKDASPPPPHASADDICAPVGAVLNAVHCDGPRLRTAQWPPYLALSTKFCPALAVQLHSKPRRRPFKSLPTIPCRR